MSRRNTPAYVQSSTDRSPFIDPAPPVKAKWNLSLSIPRPLKTRKLRKQYELEIAHNRIRREAIMLFKQRLLDADVSIRAQAACAPLPYPEGAIAHPMAHLTVDRAGNVEYVVV